MEKREQASTFDPELFEEIQQTISDQLGSDSGIPDLEDHILGEDAQTPEEKNLLDGQFCYEFVNSPMYSLYVKSLMKMVAREHRKFESAESDPGDRLRLNWRAYQRVVTEIIGNIESGSELYLSSQK